MSTAISREVKLRQYIDAAEKVRRDDSRNKITTTKVEFNTGITMEYSNGVWVVVEIKNILNDYPPGTKPARRKS